MKFIVHAGVHKSGTGTIQAFFAENAAALKERGVYYPVGFFRKFKWQHSELSFAIRRGDLSPVRDFFKHCARERDEGKIHTVVVSGEELSLLDVDGVRTLRAEMLASDPGAEVKIILYFRNLYDVSISLIQHRARRNRWIFRSFRDEKVIAHSNPSRQIADFEDVFGEENVTVGIFDTAILDPGLERHFMQLAGIEWFDDLEQTDTRNVSGDLISTAFLNMLSCEYGLSRKVWRVSARAMPQPYVFPILRNELIEGLRGAVSSIDVSHPKLQHARSVLTEVTQPSGDHRPELGEFLDSFEAMLGEVRIAFDVPSKRAHGVPDEHQPGVHGG